MRKDTLCCVTQPAEASLELQRWEVTAAGQARAMEALRPRLQRWLRLALALALGLAAAACALHVRDRPRVASRSVHGSSRAPLVPVLDKRCFGRVSPPALPFFIAGGRAFEVGHKVFQGALGSSSGVGVFWGVSGVVAPRQKLISLGTSRLITAQKL